VHEFLRHLEHAGFGGSPRVLGTEGALEVLTYLPGEVANDPGWQPGRGHRLPAYARTDAALRAAAAMIRQLHDAAAGFSLRETGYRVRPRPPLPGEIITHGDLGPWNTVYRNGRPAGFIDFDGAQPGDPVTELASAAWAFVPLAPPDQLRQAGFDPLPDLPGRLRIFIEAYGLAQPSLIVPALTAARLDVGEQVRSWGAGPAGAAGALEFTAGELRWLASIEADLVRAL
jgi:aminoglycoside phosphotransferase (APT) family kinase protein